MCFHWKSLRRQVRVSGSVEKVADLKLTIITIQDLIKIKLERGHHRNLKL